jgi:hypothetical protein
VPRHPAGGTPARLAGLPQTQKLLWTALTAARREVVESQPRATVDAAAHAAAMAAMGTLEAAAVGEGVGEAAVEAAAVGEGVGEAAVEAAAVGEGVGEAAVEAAAVGEGVGEAAVEAAAVGEGVGEAAVEAAEGEGEGEGGDFWLGAALDLPAAAKGGARRWDFAATGFPYR